MGEVLQPVPRTTKPCAVIFDVFGTLVDYRTSVAREVRHAFGRRGHDVDPLAFVDAWRGAYDPSMEPVRSGRRAYVPLDDLHYENLCSVMQRFELTGVLNRDQTFDLSRAWERLDPWEDAVAGLDRLRSGTLIAPCSNGSTGLMVRLARHAGFSWDCILGADIAKTYKPEPDVYRASCNALRLPPGRVMMVAAHNHDLEAAAAVGLQTGFFPRATECGPGQTTDLSPTGDWTVVATDVVDLAIQLGL